MNKSELLIRNHSLLDVFLLNFYRIYNELMLNKCHLFLNMFLDYEVKLHSRSNNHIYLSCTDNLEALYMPFLWRILFPFESLNLFNF